MIDGAVDRTVLGRCVLNSPENLKQLEDIIHPLVASERNIFFEKAQEDGVFAVVYDIPLLYEKSMQDSLDYVVVVTASEETQRQRVLNRPGASVERFEAILSKQLPDSEKRQLANYVINTDYEGFTEARSQLCRVLEDIVDRNSSHYESWKVNYKASGMDTSLFLLVTY